MEYDIKIDKYGSKFYYKKGTHILHREGKPAIEYANGETEWWVNNKRHRTDGPAVIWIGDFNFIYPNEWWVNGVRLSEEKEEVLNKWWDNKNGILFTI